jgi:hypothetical protein
MTQRTSPPIGAYVAAVIIGAALALIVLIL